MDDFGYTPQTLARRSMIDRHSQLQSRDRFSHGALVTKDEILSIQQPTSELRTTLATTYWLQKALAEIGVSNPFQTYYFEERLRRESLSPITSSSRSFSFSEAKSDPASLTKLSAEVRAAIWDYCISCSDPNPPLSQPPRSFASATSTFRNTGLPALAEVFPKLKTEVNAMLPAFYRSNTFRFDIREECGIQALRDWIEENEDETSMARTISIRHWTWWHTENGTWRHAADETVLTLLPTGYIRLTRRGGKFDPAACNCELEDYMHRHCQSWKINKPWSVADFAEALREEDELLIQAVNKFVDFVQKQNDEFDAWRDDPKPCIACGKEAMVLRSSEDI